MPFALLPFHRQNGFPFPQRTAAEETRGKLLAKIRARTPGALEAYRAEMAISMRVANDDPMNVGWQGELAVVHEHLGDLPH